MSHDFFSLTPDATLDAVESALKGTEQASRATGRCWALNSVENRVYEIELENSTSIIAKFYRPGRWKRDQILEEHRFLSELDKAEVPVVPPLLLSSASTLCETDSHIFFSIFPKMRGKSRDELRPDQLELLGRFLARLHNVGEGFGRSKRLQLNVRSYGQDSLKFLENSGFIEEPVRARYLQIGHALCRQIAPMLHQVPTQIVHGDCHFGNLLWNESGPFFVDFDDMVEAPVVQDFWMIVGGRDDYAKRDRDIFLEAYEQMRHFDDSQLKLMEPLRALRLLHYSAWIARRWDDPSFPRLFPQFGTERYWQEEIEALYQIQALLDTALDGP